MWLTGLVAPRHVGSSQTRARTRVPCTGRQTLNHCATREAPSHRLLFSSEPHPETAGRVRCYHYRCIESGSYHFRREAERKKYIRITEIVQRETRESQDVRAVKRLPPERWLVVERVNYKAVKLLVTYGKVAKLTVPEKLPQGIQVSHWHFQP